MHLGQLDLNDVTAAIDRHIAAFNTAINDFTSTPGEVTWEAYSRLDDAEEALSLAWGYLAHLNGVMNSPAVREVYNANQPKITAFYTAMAQNEDLFRQFKKLAARKDLTPHQQRALALSIRGFVLGGAELDGAAKARFKALQEEKSKLSTKFSENLLDATDRFVHIVENPQELAGLPEDVQAMAQAEAEKRGVKGYAFTLQAPSVFPALQYAENRELRRALYEAYITRASEFGEASLDNAPVISQLLRLRREAAALLGYGSAAHVSLATKMADTPEQVIQFLNDLGGKGRPLAEKDFTELVAFAREELGIEDFQPWDTSFASERLSQARYAFSDQEVKQYFPEPQVMKGLGWVLQSLYCIHLKPFEATEAWHEDVKPYAVENSGGETIGYVYLDLYARSGKRAGAWMNGHISRRERLDGKEQLPVAFVVCNFSRPVGGRPALLRHDEVITLFHEFGHAMHHVLTQVGVPGIAGISGVEWDAVELPSQFMENFCWEWETLQQLTAHVDTGEKLPRELYDKMLAAKNFQSGMAMVRQVELSLFDMHLHWDFDHDAGSPLELLAEIRTRVAVTPAHPQNRFPNSFSHIFAGGYAAGYYSYKWAEVLSADAYAAFEENGGLNREDGQRFWREVLAVGGSRPAMESFVAFRGRPPQVDALLRHNGLQVH